jgi:hypothetical protein
VWIGAYGEAGAILRNGCRVARPSAIARRALSDSGFFSGSPVTVIEIDFLVNFIFGIGVATRLYLC